jgi:hypothetical protein
MIKIGTFLWIILTIILVAFPVVLISFFISKRVQKGFGTFYNKIRHIQVLKKFKEEIIFRGKKPQPIVEVSAEEGQSQEPTQVSSSEDQDEPIVIVQEEIDIIQNIVEAPTTDSPVPQQEEMIIDKESFLKNKKLLEKIVYEALVLRKEGKLDDYEKKLIE